MRLRYNARKIGWSREQEMIEVHEVIFYLFLYSFGPPSCALVAYHQEWGGMLSRCIE